MSAHHGAGMSNVGHGAFYEAGDQRNEPRSMANERERYKEGQHGSHHDLDSKDDRSLANKLAAEQQHGGGNKPNKHNSRHSGAEADLSQKDPTRPATLHSHEPSKGAKVDKELQEDDEKRLREKGL